MIVFVAFVGMAIAASPVTRSFPQDNLHLANSQNSRELYAVSNESMDPAHTLYMRDKVSGAVVEVMSFPRSVQVGWSPRGDRFFVNNKYGSNRSDCRVVEATKKMEIRWLEVGVGSEYKCEGFDPTDHCYIKCVAWNGESELSGTFESYGDVDVKKTRIKLKVMKP